jgi:WD40 repeat protein/Ca2+-binding EF-hand superfamily protein
MGQEISKIVFNQDLEDIKVSGLSKVQVEMLTRTFECYASKTQSKESKFGAKNLANLLKLPLAEAENIIKYADMDGDEYLNSYEFICLVGLFTQKDPEERMNALFSLFDEDNSDYIAEHELERMVRCVITINENGKEPTKSQISAKLNQIKEVFFLSQIELKKSEFVYLCSEDTDFQTAFIKAGIFRKEEFNEYNCLDLNDEINRNLDEDGEELEDKDDMLNDNAEFDVAEEEKNEFMAVRPYLGVVKNSVPSNFKPGSADLTNPGHSLKLEYVHGYRCFDTRNNVFWGGKDSIIFHTAALGVSMDTSKNEQSFTFMNTDDITAIAKFKDYVATGQIGHKPIINIWDCKTMETMDIIVGQLQKGISNLDFSKSGKYLAGVAMNDDHDIAVYDVSDIRKPKLFASGKGVKDTVLHMKFKVDGNENQLLLATQKELYCADFNKTGIRVSKVSGWGSAERQACLSIGFLKGCDALVGLVKGDIAVVRGKSIGSFFKAHNGAVFAMTNDSQLIRLLTGGADGKIMIWDEAFKKIGEINMMEERLNLTAPKLRALSFNEETNKILAGTRSGDLVEVVLNQPGKGRVLLRGHFDYELWGLTTHPNKEEYLTVGEDCLLGKWSIHLKTQIQSAQLKIQAKCIHLNHKGDQFAIGTKNGKVLIWDYTSFKQTKELATSKKEISVIKYSPDSAYLAVGAHDSVIYLYDVAKGYTLIKTMKGDHSTITHLDYSTNGRTLQSTCTSMELLYWNLPDCKQNTSGASANRDEEWASWSCTIGWPVQGVYPPCADGTDVNSVCRNKTKEVIATADDFGMVKLFRYPCLKGSLFSKYVGHSSHVTGVDFTYNDKYLISIGGNDKSIFQWSVNRPDTEDDEVQFETGEEFDPSEIQHRYKDDEEPVEEEKESMEVNGLKIAEEEGNEFMAIKPWKGDLQASIPSWYVYKKGMEGAPANDLKLSYVNGYRCFEARETAAFDDTGENVVFATAALGVNMNLAKNTQSFFQGHDNDVISFDLHPSRKIAATGQMAQKGKSKNIDIFVWDIVDKKILAHFNTFHLRAVQCIKFSPSGNKLLTFGQDDDNSLAIYEWAKGLLLATAKVDKANVLDAEFTSESNFYSCGSKHLKTWTFNGKNATGGNVSWKAMGNKAEAVVSLTNDDSQNILASTGTGKLLLIKNGSIVTFNASVHSGPIWVTHYSDDSKTFLTGGKDGSINEISVANSKITLVRCVLKMTSADSPNFSVKVLDTHKGNLLIGTGGNDLIKVDHWQKESKKKLLLSGHYGDELWGLACHPIQPVYATCSDDTIIKTWHAANRKMIAFKSTGVKMRAIDYSKCGKFLVVASMCGKVIVLDSDLKEEIVRVQTPFNKANQWIEDIKFAPNNNFIALGAHGGVSPILVYEFDGKILKVHASITVGFTSALLHLDWSEDSSFIVANSQAYELKFADVNGKKQAYAKGMKDVEWSSWTCKIGFPSQGIFPGVMGSEVNTVARSFNKQILATGENSQLVKLFRYPCTIEKSGFKSYQAHSSFCTRVRFTPKDVFLISAGGHDNTTMIWKTDWGFDEEVSKLIPKEDTEFAEDTQDWEEDEAGDFIKEKRDRNKYFEEEEKAFEPDDNEYEGLNVVGEEEKNEFMAIKPWLGAIKTPSNPAMTHTSDKDPLVVVDLEYVYGYRSKDCRNNVIWSNNKIFYNVAGVAVGLDPKSNTQTFFREHRDDVISIAYCQSKGIFATGEIGPKPRLFLWDAKDMSKIGQLEGGIIKGVASLAFSPNGEYLVATCIDDNHHVALFNVNTKSYVHCDKGDTANIVACEFINDKEFVTVGLKHYKLWKAGSPLTATKGNLSGGDDKLTSCKRYKTSILCGTVSGDLQVWNGTSRAKSVKVHKTSLDAICVLASNFIITAGKDYKLNILDDKFTLIQCWDMSELLQQGMNNQIRAVTMNPAENEMYVGTYASEIYQLTYSGNMITAKPKMEDLTVKQLMSGHYAKNLKWTNEIWGLTPLKDTRFLTVSDDGTLRVWSSTEKKLEHIVKLNIDAKGVPLERDKKTGDLQDSAKLRSVTVCQEDKHVAVGCMDGTVRIVDVQSWKQIKLIKNRKRWISEVRYSPNNEYLAVGSHDDIIDIYQVNNKYKLMHSMKKHSSFITHLDWSLDSNYLHSNCGAYELLFWDVNTGKQLTSGASALKDEDWDTWSCVLGYPVQGIFKACWDGSDVNMVDRSKAKTSQGFRVLAAGDDFSNIRLYNYPILKKQVEGIILHGHSSHVTNVKFDKDDEYLYSTGGEDQSVMQWKVKWN